MKMTIIGMMVKMIITVLPAKSPLACVVILILDKILLFFLL